EPHLQDGLRLNLAQSELGHEPLAGRRGIGGAANDRDRSIEIFYGDLQAGEDVKALLCLPEIVRGATDDDLAAVAEKHLQGTLERQEARPPVDYRQHVDAERLLQRGVLVELVQQ